MMLSTTAGYLARRTETTAHISLMKPYIQAIQIEQFQENQTIVEQSACQVV
jgi:hypothetical protein